MFFAEADLLEEPGAEGGGGGFGGKGSGGLGEGVLEVANEGVEGGVGGELLFEGAGFLGIEEAEGVEGGLILEEIGHARPPCRMSRRRMRPRRMLVLTVPRGRPRDSEMEWWVRPLRKAHSMRLRCSEGRVCRALARRER